MGISFSLCRCQIATASVSRHLRQFLGHGRGPLTRLHGFASRRVDLIKGNVSRGHTNQRALGPALRGIRADRLDCPEYASHDLPDRQFQAKLSQTHASPCSSRAGFGTLWICHTQTGKSIGVPVMAPLVHVSVHVMQSPGVGQSLSHQMGLVSLSHHGCCDTRRNQAAVNNPDHLRN